MSKALCIHFLSLALASAPGALAAQDEQPDAQLARGVELARGGSFVSATMVLDEVVRRLTAEGGAPSQLARQSNYGSVPIITM